MTLYDSNCRKDGLKRMGKLLFENVSVADSKRILYTPSHFARASLLHLQETGSLTATMPHRNSREGMASYLFFLVQSGSGQLEYEGNVIPLKQGTCVFLDCTKSYAHLTDSDLWTLSWVHFYGPNMAAVYNKFRERGGKPAFLPKNRSRYAELLEGIFAMAGSSDYVRDMKLNMLLSKLLVFLMEDAWTEENISSPRTHSKLDIQELKDYLDSHVLERITLDQLAATFFINKYYMSDLFKARYGITVGAYILQQKVTYAKEQLRFSNKTIEAIAAEMNVDHAYLTRLFRNTEGITPSVYRKQWQGRIHE